MRNQIILKVVIIGSLIFSGVQIFRFSNCQVDDAFIVYKYSENLIDNGELAYNVGERINALTSPMHSLILSLFYGITGKTALMNKIIGIAFMLIMFIMYFRTHKNNLLSILLFCGAVSCSSFLAFWVSGGLETIFLAFSVFIFVWYYFKAYHQNSLKLLITTFFLGGLVFTFRFDSILFTGPVLLHLLIKNRYLDAVKLITLSLTGLVFPLLILGFNYSYFGDIMPTSFYVKKPILGGVFHFLYNLTYTFDFLLNSGTLILIVLLAGISIFPKTNYPYKKWIRSHLGLVSGLFIFLVVYGTLTSRTHMMYSYRFYAPYLPILVLIILRPIDNIMYNAQEPHISKIRLFGTIAAFIIIGLQFMNLVKMNSFSLGTSPLGEVSNVSLLEYQDNFIGVHSEAAETIRAHWQTHKPDINTQPRLYTFTGGYLPYLLKEFYTIEILGSYRHSLKNQTYDFKQYTHYYHHQIKGGASNEEIRALYGDQFEIIWHKQKEFGTLFSWVVMYNNTPKDIKFPVNINGDIIIKK